MGSLEIKELLETKLSFFKEAGLREEILGRAQLVTVAAGAAILKEGSYVKTVPVLLSGLVKVIREEVPGREMLLYYIYPRESCIISINCGINDVKSSIKAIAEEESQAVLLPANLIGEWQRKYNSFNSFILNLYHKRFDDVLNAYNALAFQSLDDRLMTWLHDRATALKSSKIKATHQDLADELGAARETISRMLKKLEIENQVILHRGWIEVVQDRK